MPPRHAYWTILIGEAPTAFRAREREELLPTFERLRAKQPDAVMKWFERGRLWSSPDEARGPAPAAPGERRGREWRPGGAHRDPRDRFKKDKKKAATSSRAPRAGQRENRPRDEEPGADRGQRRPWQPRPDPRGTRPARPEERGDRPARPGPQREERPGRPKGPGATGDRPWRPKPPGGAGADKPWRPKGPGATGDRPWRPKPPGGAAGADKAWRPKGPGATGDRPWRPKPPGGAAGADKAWRPKGPGATGDRPWRPKPPGGAGADKPWRPKPPEGESKGPKPEGQDRSPREERARKGGTRLVKKVRR